MDDDGGKIGIEHGRAERVLEAADEDRLIDECVQRPAKPAPFGRKRRPARGRRAGDDQDFEIGSMRVRLPKRRRQDVRRHAVVILVLVPFARILTEGPREQRAGDAAGSAAVACASFAAAWSRSAVINCEPGIGVKFLGRGHLGKRRLELGAAARTCWTTPRPVPPDLAIDRRVRRDRRKTDRCEEENGLPWTYEHSRADRIRAADCVNISREKRIGLFKRKEADTLV